MIVHLYEEHGLDFVSRLRGMFALALWDARRRRLVLARDRLGIKPLHYAITADGLFFGSEQKAILASGAIEPRADIQSLRQLLSYGRIVAPRTIVSGIRRLPAGHTLTWSDGHADIRQYWEAMFPARDEYDRSVSEQDWADGLRDKLTESVSMHLRSDVPVGAWLSAGIDSSAVTALMSRLIAGQFKPSACASRIRGSTNFATRKGWTITRNTGLPATGSSAATPTCNGCRRRSGTREDSLLGAVGVGQQIVAEATAAHVKVVLTGEGVGRDSRRIFVVSEPAAARPGVPAAAVGAPPDRRVCRRSSADGRARRRRSRVRAR